MENERDLARRTAIRRIITILETLTALMEEDVNKEGGLTKAKWKEVRKTLKYISRAALLNQVFNPQK